MSEYSIPYGRQNIEAEDIQAVLEVLQADFLTQGPKVKEFEDKFSEYTGAKYAVAVSNATAALHIGSIALGLKAGGRIITTPITFVASANCALYSGAEVWFADIDADSYLLDIKAVRRLIESKESGFFDGIIPVDFAGLPVNLEEYRKLCDEHGLWLMEDACHAPGGYFTNSKGEQNLCGNGSYADLSIFSFHPVKHIACGEGGIITTNSEELYKSLMKLRSHGITKENISKNDGGWFYEMQELGYNYRLTDIQSALGISQLAKNPKGVSKRNEIAQAYKAAFAEKIKYQSLPQGRYNAHHLFVIEVEDRKGLYDHLRENGIYAQIHYIPVHTFPYYQKHGFEGADLSRAEKYYSGCISLPMFPTLTNDEQDYVIQKTLEFVNG
jgi:UDP-4-amino-4,6-dideoxy-N-acetyl-beta-L-altrosamine transaminase